MARSIQYNKKLYVVCLLLIAVTALTITGCATLPSPPEKPHVHSLPPATDGMLAEVSQQLNHTYGPEESGFLLLRRNDEALKWRLALSEQLAEHFDKLMAPENAWSVYLDKKNKIRWESSSGMVSRQPARSFGQRISDFFFRLLPIESQL